MIQTITRTTYVPDIDLALQREIDALQLKMEEAIRTRVPSGAPNGGLRGVGEPSKQPQTRTDEEVISAIDQQIERLEQVRGWLAADPHLHNLIDGAISNRVKVSEARQNRNSIVVSVVSLVAGWLLSFITPSTITDFIRHLLSLIPVGH